ncbi:MAG: hypothetical protein LBS49_13090 [Candidatus Accumulibacter sp.]|nr:hypothetical protein [Accumulibacter sp.]
MSCSQCAAPVRVYRTLFFVDALLKKHMDALREIQRLQTEAATAIPPKTVSATTQQIRNIDVFNTNVFAQEAQHAAIVAWFAQKGWQTQIHVESVDTTGFYDEMAVQIGDNYSLYKNVLDAIRWAQREGRPSCQVRLEKGEKQRRETDNQAIVDFCQKLYDTTLVARFFHNRKEKTLTLWIQDAKNAQNFFDGIWLEWYALMNILKCAQQWQKKFSCARNLIISHGNGDRYELDIFFLLDSTPVCLECKSGEFRPHIERAQTLRRKLGLDSANFIMCVAGLEDENLPGLSFMHKLTFINESTLPACLQGIAQGAP